MNHGGRRSTERGGGNRKLGGGREREVRKRLGAGGERGGRERKGGERGGEREEGGVRERRGNKGRRGVI